MEHEWLFQTCDIIKCVHQKKGNPLWLSIIFHDSLLSMMFHWFSMTFHWFSIDFPLIFHWFSIDFPLIFHVFPVNLRCHFCLPSKGPPNISTSLVLGSTFKTCRKAAGEPLHFRNQNLHKMGHSGSGYRYGSIGNVHHQFIMYVYIYIIT